MSDFAFISYSRKNFEFVDQARKEIHRAAGEGRCWMDLDGIESGEKFVRKIRSTIEASYVFLFFLSEASKRSKYALRELAFAKRVFEKKPEKKGIVFVRVDDVPAKGFPGAGRLDGVDVVDWRDSRQKRKLLRDLKKWIGHAPCSRKRLVKALSRRGIWRKTRSFMERNDILDAFEMANRIDEDHPLTQTILSWMKSELGCSESDLDDLLTEARDPPKYTPLKIMETLRKRGLWICAKAELKKRGLWEAFVSAGRFDEDSPGYRPALRWLRRRLPSREVAVVLSEAEYKA